MKRMSAALCAVLILSCSSDEELIKIKRDVASLQEQVYRLETSNRDQKAELDQTLQQIRSVLSDRTGIADQGEELNLMRETLSQLEARLSDVESRSSRQSQTQVEVSSANGSESGAAVETVAGSDVEIQFRTSYGDFARGKYELAAYGFEELLNNFPNSPMAEQCHYYLGRSYYEMKNFQRSMEQFGSVIEKYGQGDFSRQSMLYQGKCFYYLNMHNKAIARLSELVKNYPGTQEAELARSFMRKAGYEN
ncbi:MAG: tetratricopeptide repeat protein [Acidobacteria bacterium]|nr:tetratricopeptide repeat protein [Acidobacteriota bacterium]